MKVDAMKRFLYAVIAITVLFDIWMSGYLYSLTEEKTPRSASTASPELQAPSAGTHAKSKFFYRFQ